jgi:plasmid stabilization system protein ParE
VTYRVRFTKGARRDIDRLYEFLLEKDVAQARKAVSAIDDAFTILRRFPFSCRKAGGGSRGPFLRELVVPFDSAGYVLLFEIEDRHTVTVLAVRHQRESDFFA